MRHSKEIIAISRRALVSLAKVGTWVAVAIAFWNRDWPAAQTFLLFLIAAEVTADE